MTDRTRRRGRTTRRAIALGCVAAVGAGVGVGIWQAEASGAPGYRMATATTASVGKTLDVSGTLEPANQAQADFQVPGTVASVSVAPGQKVTAGQTLAQLDPTAFQNQVNTAQAQLTAARAKLAADESGEATSASGGTAAVASNANVYTGAALPGSDPVVLTSTTPSSTGSGGTGGYSRTGGGTPGGAGGASGTLAGDQQAVVTAQHTADVDLQAANADLAQVVTACGGGTPGGSPGGTSPHPSEPKTTTIPAPTTTTTTTSPTTSTSEPTTTTTAPGTTTTTSPSGNPASSSAACTSALSQASAAEGLVAADQASLASAETALAQLLSSQAAAGSAAASPAGNSSSRRTNSSGSASAPGSGSSRFSSNGSGASGSAAGSQSTDTPAQLASDQATIDSDQASLTEAQQSLTATVLTSPITGTVASVGISVGETVATGSSSSAITVISDNGYVSTASLTTSQVQEVKVGDQTELTVDGATSPLDGVVSAVEPVDISNSSYTYPVTIAVTSDPSGMAVGSATQIRIYVAGAADVLAVPTSAVHTTGTGTAFVYVDQAGKEAIHRVTVGVVGPTYTQIKSGLSKGQTVVLADPSQPVPASSSNLTTRGAGGGLGRFLRGGAAGAGGAATLRNLLPSRAG